MGQQPYRYERKFLVDQMDAQQVRGMVRRHPAMFYEPYPPRYVNNLYLDTEGMENYFDNVSGTSDRRKVRIRWYGDLFSTVENPTLEFKVKRGLVGTKYSYPFAPFALDERFCHTYYRDVLRQANLPPQVREYMHEVHGVLCNRYYRRYFATKDQRFRVTIDAQMTFYQVRKAANRFLHKYVDYNHIVVELKYAPPLDVEADRISSFFPFRLTRNSKYITGIESVYE